LILKNVAFEPVGVDGARWGQHGALLERGSSPAPDARHAGERLASVAAK
jgi:hypothetical protein